MKSLGKDQVIAFRRQVYKFYDTKGRHTLPWRQTKDPYRILVSEIMLQQTQVNAVVPKYNAFLRRFPTVRSLASAPLKDVLALWQGLGYNRRALNLQRAAQKVVADFEGFIPNDATLLQLLPGIGNYTAGAVLAFAFNQPVLFIDTNIRRVYIHSFFPSRDSVADTELLPLVEQTLDRKNPCKWYNALMDYGTMLKDTHAQRRSAHYMRQSAFEGSHRQVRAAVLRELIKKPATSAHLCKALVMSQATMDGVLSELENDGFLAKRGSVYRIIHS